MWKTLNLRFFAGQLLSENAGMGQAKKILVLVEALGESAFVRSWPDMRRHCLAKPGWKQERELGRALSRLGCDVWFCGLTGLEQLEKAPVSYTHLTLPTKRIV